ncbi:MAG: sodium-independent anion transporter, partial [Chlamydiia bacterium]|nr:sodium-independent anion transporter [Chlamydiia bacterium]
MPKLLTVLFSDYSRHDLRADLIAGLTVALVALPLSIALGIASGATPAQGLITAIVGGFFISLLGGSRVQIGGPTGAFIAIIYGILPEYGYDGLVIATALAGAIMVIAGYLKFGQIIKYVPLPVVTGFTSGIAVIIVTAQVKDFFGLTVQIDSADFLVKWRAYLSNLDTVHPAALAIGSLALVIGIACRKLAPRLPRFLIALVICSAIVAGWSLPVETVGSRYPELSAGLSVPAFPAVTLARVQQL